MSYPERRLLSLIVALPILVIGVIQSFTTVGLDTLTSKTLTINQLRRDTPPTLTIAARDEQTEECRWLGTCKG